MTTNNIPRKFLKRAVDGVFLLDKPLGMSSNDAMQRVKRLFCAEKAGHTGSLDPLATGLLPICLGEAPKFSQFSLDADKTYQVVAQLGQITTTGDLEGETISRNPVPDFSSADIEMVLQTFLGLQQQIPPIYSALKYQGKPLYSFARAGKPIIPASREIQIKKITFLSYQNTCVSLEVHCSKGTYIRSLIPDLGEKLGCGATVKSLRRIEIQHYENKPMYSLNFLEEKQKAEDFSLIDAYLLPMEYPVMHLPAVFLNKEETTLLKQGQKIFMSNFNSEKNASSIFRLYDEKNFLGIAEMIENYLHPKRLLKVPSVEKVSI